MYCLVAFQLCLLLFVFIFSGLTRLIDSFRGSKKERASSSYVYYYY